MRTLGRQRPARRVNPARGTPFAPTVCRTDQVMPHISYAVAVLLTLVGVCGLTCGPAHLSAASQVRATRAATGGRNAPETLDKPYLVLVSLDGFRSDYLELYDAPNLKRLASRGAQADAFVPVFPSLTFPSHYSIATGLYPARHGIVGNVFYDPGRDASYSYRNPTNVTDGTWYGGEPIWATAETQGMVAATSVFVGSEAAIDGVRPTFSRAVEDELSLSGRVDEVLGWLRLPPVQRPHFLTLYSAVVDTAGHRWGPLSPEVAAAVRQADQMIARLDTGIRALAHGQRVHVLVVSDHGMAALAEDGYHALDDAIDLGDVRVGTLGPVTNLFARGGPESARTLQRRLRRALPDVAVYLRAEVPARLRYTDNSRIGDLVLIADEGHTIGIGPDDSLPAGLHGWDPRLPSMHGIFLAAGPGIIPGARLSVVNSVDVYPLIADLLGLTPPADLDGSLDALAGLLIAPP